MINLVLIFLAIIYGCVSVSMLLTHFFDSLYLSPRQLFESFAWPLSILRHFYQGAKDWWKNED